MVDGTTTRSDISQRTEAYASRQMLKHAEPVFVLEKFGLSKPVPRNMASSVKFRRRVVFPAATTPLTEGVTPAPRKMSYEDVSATLNQYGDWVEITDRVDDENEDPVLADATLLLGEQMGKTVEQVIYGSVKAGTQVAYTNGAARSSVNTPITLAAQRGITRALKAQHAMKFTRILAASPDYATRAVEASFVAVAHTDMENDIRGLPGFTKAAEYGTRSQLCPEEIGAVDDMRYVLSPDLAPFADGGGTYDASGTAMVSTGGSNADVYPVLYFGMEAYGLVPLRGRGLNAKKYGSNAPRIMVLNPNQARGGDPLGQRGSAGWKGTFSSLILNQTWMYRLESAATAL